MKQDNEPTPTPDIGDVLSAYQSGEMNALKARAYLLLPFGAFRNKRVEQLTTEYIMTILTQVKSGELSVELAALGIADVTDASQQITLKIETNNTYSGIFATRENNH